MAGFLESRDPGVCGGPDKCPLFPQSPEESLKLTGINYQNPGEERRAGEPGVVREDFLQEATAGRAEIMQRIVGRKKNERMEGLKQCFPEGGLWN